MTSTAAIPPRVLPLPAAKAATARVKTPTLLQMEAVECGAAALGIVLGAFGRHVPLEELRLACGVSRDGSKASNIVKAAAVYGLVAHAYKKEPADLDGLALPMILHWNFNHFVVLEGFRGERVFINDPATGPRVISREELDQAFTGVVLLFERGPRFVQGGERTRPMVSLGRRLGGSRGALLHVVLAGLLLVVPGLVVPTFSKLFMDDVLVRGTVRWLRPMLLAMTVTALVLAALTWLQQLHLLRLETKLALSSSARFFWHVLRLPVVFFTQRAPGEIANRVGLNDRVAQLLSGDLATTLLSLVVIAFYAALMLQYDVLLAAITVATGAANIALLRYVARRRADINARLMQDAGKLMATAMGGMQAIESSKAMGSESELFARWAGYQAKVLNAQQELRRQMNYLSALPPLLLAVNSALLLGVGGLRVIDGRLSVGMLLAFQALAVAFLSPVNRLVTLEGAFQEVAGSLGRLDDVLRAPPDARAALDDSRPPAADEPVKLRGHLELRKVSFGYGRLDPPLIEDFDLVLRPGSRVALVGGSGCGKTTIAKLVSGLYEPWSGDVLFDGRPRAEIAPRVLRHSLAVVDQDIFLFEDTVRENLSMWDSTIPESAVLEAARDAAIHDEIAARPGGYGGRIEEAGRNLSGGQRQRLEIARALAGNPTILVLDEATSALDPSMEEEIDDNLRRRGCTCLIIAHRLSTIRDCDEILVMEKGKVVQRGTHDAMKDVPGPYQRLIGAA